MSDAFAPATFGAPARPRRIGGWRDGLHMALLLAFLAYVFIGTQPLGEPAASQRADGSPLDRIVVFSMFGLALAVLWANRREAAAMLTVNIALAGVVGFCLVSVAWSDYPGLTLRRALLLVLLTTITAAIAAGVTDLRRLHTTLFATLTAVMLLNLAVTAIAPGVAITDIGVRGIYSQKNVAGVAAMIAVVVAATWILGAPRFRSVAIGLAGLAPAAALLAISRSKTSIALAAVALALMAAFVAAERIGPRFILMMVVAGALALCGLLVTLAAFDFDLARLAAAFTGDASFTGRDELWSFALRSALERPWLGHGYGAFWDVGPENDPLRRIDPGSWLGDVDVGVINQAHNGFLELWLHIGLPMMVVATLVVVGGVVRGARYAVSAYASRSERAVIGMFAALLLLHLVHNMTEATLFMRGVAFCNVAMLALLVLSRTKIILQLRRTSASG